MDQYALGWSQVWDDHVFDGKSIEKENLVRIAARYKTSYDALTTSGMLLNCHLPGKVLRSAFANNELPAVGDWCVIGETFTDLSNEKAAQILELLPRRSKLSRMGAGTDAAEQILAANVDIVFVVTSVTRDFNINRLKRFVLLATYGNATPILVLSKVDLVSMTQEPDSLDALDSMSAPLQNLPIEELKQEFPAVEILVTSCHNMIGIDAIRSKLTPGTTAVFVGSSGVGKSTLVNKLLGGEVQKTKDIRTDVQKGRHTTSASQLFFIREGGMIIDTPGLREVGLLADDEDLDLLVPSVSIFATGCRFRDCSHTNEPECAVQSALETGDLPQDDLDGYVRLGREAAFNRRKLDQRLAQEERKRWKKITVQNRKDKKSQRW